MTEKLEDFLSGERLDDVAIYVSAAATDDVGVLTAHGIETENGVVLVVPGERGRRAFSNATGLDPMAFAREAMRTEGAIDSDLASGTCPECGSDDLRLVFAFAEEQNEGVGGLYAEGDVVHAYARCGCGSAYSDRWVAGNDE